MRNNINRMKIKIRGLQFTAEICSLMPGRPSDEYIVTSIHNAIDVAYQLRDAEHNKVKIANYDCVIATLHYVRDNRHKLSTAELGSALESAAMTLNSLL